VTDYNGCTCPVALGEEVTTCCGNQTLLEILATDYNEQFITVPAEVEQQLLRINLHKSPGSDGLPNWMLKDFAPIITVPLAAIFDASFQEGCFPPIWRSVELLPVPTINPLSSIHNYFTYLLPTLDKVLNRLSEESFWSVASS